MRACGYIIITRHEAFAVPGHITAMLFQYHEPVLGLRETDQEFLSAAIAGLTDEELARSLNRRLPSIRSTGAHCSNAYLHTPTCSPRCAMDLRTLDVVGRNVNLF